MHPFGPGSTFRRLSDAGARVVGLGVSLNTSSLSHLPDYDLAAICPVNVFSEMPIEGDIINYQGTRLRTRTFIVRAEVMATYRPSALFEYNLPLREQLTVYKHENVIYFSYPIGLFHHEGIAVGRQFLSAGRLPPWLGDMAIETNH
jgi:hypothetical protein